MRVAVQFAAEHMELEVADDRLIRLSGETVRLPVADLAAGVAAAIEAPLDFPPLRQAVVPGDHVAIVLDDGIPHAGEVLGPLIECLIGADVQPGDIQIVQVPPSGTTRNGLTPDGLPLGVRFVQHDPQDRNRLSYLASTQSGVRVYLNREVVDADLVVLVGRVDYHPILGYRGTGSSVYPGLADDEAARRFRTQIGKPISQRSRAAARRETDEVSWLLGIQFAVQLLMGPGNAVVQVLAGRCDQVQRKGQELVDTVWSRSVARRADMVIAGISGEAEYQGFEELGTVLAAACRVVREGGQVIVLSAIDTAPGPALRSVQGFEEPARVLEHVVRHPAVDAISTWQIARAVQHARVYLLSRLDDDLVEDLFMTPLADEREVQRLLSQAASCLFLNDAQLTHATVEGKDEEPAV
ncbi:MAG: DUF2088 domain-containing protein [Planctomycetes bacterium]|nr:DUF2088 domain-containing protein [Planctomycetota bacterium]